MSERYEYLAIPYTHEDEKVREYRAKIADTIFAAMMLGGRLIYSPISSSHHIAVNYDLPNLWNYWERLDKCFIAHCKRVIVVTLDGWKESVGVTAEIEYAKELGIPIEYIDPEDYI